MQSAAPALAASHLASFTPAWGKGFNQLSEFDQLVVWFNWTGSFAAIVINLVAMRYARGWWKIMHSVMGALATVYALLYLTLIFGPFTAEAWARALRGFSVIVWPLVWSGPGLIGLRRHRRHHAHDTARVISLVADQLSAPAPEQLSLPFSDKARYG